jgi:hypothetical protein
MFVSFGPGKMVPGGKDSCVGSSRHGWFRNCCTWSLLTRSHNLDDKSKHGLRRFDRHFVHTSFGRSLGMVNGQVLGLEGSAKLEATPIIVHGMGFLVVVFIPQPNSAEALLGWQVIISG